MLRIIPSHLRGKQGMHDLSPSDVDAVHNWFLAAFAVSGLTQAELARQLEEKTGKLFDRSMANKIVKGRRSLSFAEIIAVSEIFGVSPPSVVERAGEVKVEVIALHRRIAELEEALSNIRSLIGVVMPKGKL